MQNGRVSRRTMLGASARAGVGAAGLALVGCGDDDDGEQAAAQTPVDQTPVDQEQAVAGVGTGLLPGELTAEQEAAGLSREEELRLRYHWTKLANIPGQEDGPQYGGSWTFGSTDPGTWDPLGATGALLAAFALYFMNQLVSFPLGDHDPNNWVRPQGDLATGWETPDPETWVFSLDQEINWQNVEPLNGRAMTMEDVKIGYEALGEAPVQGRDYAVVRGIDADEAGRTVRFNLNEPAPYLINVMMTPYHVVVAPELIGTDFLETQVASTGPFILEEHEVGVRFRASRNPDYFRTDPRTGMKLPYLDEIIGLDNLSNRDVEVAAWATGDQFQIRTLDDTQFDEAIDLQPEAITTTTAPPPGWQPHIVFKLEEAPWNDVRVRQALSLLMNREDQSNGIYDGFAAAGVGMDWTFFADPDSPFGGREWPWTFEELERDLGGSAVFDPARGIALLESAGFNSDNPLVFDLDFHNFPLPGLRLVEPLVDQWNTSSGGAVQATLVPGEWLAWFGKLPSKDYKDVLGHFQYGPAQDPDQYTFGPMHSDSPGNFYSINDPDVDEWALAQRTEVDPDAREQLWKNIVQRDQEQSYRLWMVNNYRTQHRLPWFFNHSDTYNAWNPGWGEKGAELVWFHEEMRNAFNA